MRAPPRGPAPSSHRTLTLSASHCPAQSCRAGTLGGKIPPPPGPPALRPHPSQDRPLEAPRASFRKVVLALGGKAPLVPFLLILCSSLMLPCRGEVWRRRGGQRRLTTLPSRAHHLIFWGLSFSSLKRG